MRYSEYSEGQAPPEGAREGRAREADARLVDRLERETGAPLDLQTAEAWADLVTWLRGATREDWRAVVQRGLAAVPVLQSAPAVASGGKKKKAGGE